MVRRIQVLRSFVVSLSADQAFALWRRFSDFPRFMKHVESVEELDATRSRWTVGGRARRSATWIAEIEDEEPGRLLAWRAAGHGLRHRGRVEFYEASAGRGTVVSVRMSYEAPADAIDRALGAVFEHDPETQIRWDLRRFQRLAEKNPPRSRTTAVSRSRPPQPA